MPADHRPPAAGAGLRLPGPSPVLAPRGDDRSPEAGAGRRAQQKAETRARLLAAARRVFSEGSVVTTPLDAVAAAAGVSKATLFFHFNARSDLLGAVASQLYVEILTELGTVPSSDLRAFLSAYLTVQRDPRLALLWEIGDVLSADGQPLPDVAYRHINAQIDALLRRSGVAPARARRLAGVLAPAAFLVARRVAFGQGTDEEVARFLDDVEHLVRSR